MFEFAISFQVTWRITHTLFCGIVLIAGIINPAYAEEVVVLPDSTARENPVDERRAETQKKLESIIKSLRQQIEDEQTEKEHRDPALELDGLVINETRTRIGQDFYDYFYTLWEAPAKIADYTVYIEEKPIGIVGSWVSIKVNDTYIYRNRHTPRREELENSAEQAVALVRQYLLQREENDRELTGRDMSGTGIY